MKIRNNAKLTKISLGIIKNCIDNQNTSLAFLKFKFCILLREQLTELNLIKLILN